MVCYPRFAPVVTACALILTACSGLDATGTHPGRTTADGGDTSPPAPKDAGARDDAAQSAPTDAEVPDASSLPTEDDVPDAARPEEPSAPKCSHAETQRETCVGGARERTCVSGVWGAWSACQCVTDAVEDVSCGVNGRGVQARVCRAGVFVDDGPCEDLDRCEDGARDVLKCGHNGRGEDVRVCSLGQWEASQGCDDPDECIDERPDARTCGLNGRGTEVRTCQNGRWSQYGRCSDTDECTDDDTDLVACGRNGRGRAALSCTQGTWGEPGACADPDECIDTKTDSEPCGLNRRGTRERRCDGGQWGEWAKCIDPDRCEDNDQISLPCGINQRGRTSRTCKSGAWSEWTQCDDRDVCTDQDVNTLRCGVNGRGQQTQRCVLGQWEDPTQCIDLDVCLDKEEAGFACGFNDRGTVPRRCVAGRWQDIGLCRDPDECLDGGQQEVVCGWNRRGRRPYRCTAGTWTPESACNDPDECRDGAVQPNRTTCGLNNRGRTRDVCSEGAWQTECVDPDVCTDGEASTEACGPDGSAIIPLTCQRGQWSREACTCPAGRTRTCDGRCVPKPSRVYMRPIARACEDGLSWANGYSNVAKALAAVEPGGEVWLAEGTYYLPGADTVEVSQPVSLLGGFAGQGAQPDARDFATRRTTVTRRDPGGRLLSIQAEGAVVLEGLWFTGARPASDFIGERGGAIQAFRSAVTVRHCGFEDNIANDGGAAIVGDEKVSLVDCVFTRNRASAKNWGGAVNGAGLIERCTFRENECGYAGAAIHVNTVRDSTFEGNRAQGTVSGTGSGGALYDVGRIERCTFTGNRAEYGGGAVSSGSGRPMVTIGHSVFENNVAGHGGAVTVDQTLHLANSVFRGNVAERGNGGALSIGSAEITAVNTLFVGNSTLAHHSWGYSGGAISLYASTADIRHCTFANNQASAPGGAIWATEGSSAAIAQSLFAYNVSASRSGHHVEQATSELKITTSSFTGQAIPSGAGNISAEPVFESGSYRPSANSPTVNAADPARVPLDTLDLDADGDLSEPLPIDLDGSPRSVGRPDMGCYESQQP